MSAAKSLLGKIAIVTGASSGNGRSFAIALANAGASVVCSDLRPEARQDGYEDNIAIPTHEVIKKNGGQSIFQKADVAQSRDIEQLVETCVANFGRLDIMVNNAGIFAGMKNIIEETEEEYDRIMAINARGTYMGCKYALKQFLAQSEPDNSNSPDVQDQPSIGKIINIASSGGLVGLAQAPAYCASKAAVVNLTRQLAVDFSPKRINVNAVCPSFLATAMVRPFIEIPEVYKTLREATLWPRLGTPKDVSDIVLFLASSQSDWMTGSSLTIDGGFTAR